MAAGAAAVEPTTLLAAPDQDLSRLVRRVSLGPYRLQAGQVKRLRSIFVDTPDLTLTRSGATLRLWRQAGRWQATFTRLSDSAGPSREPEAVTVPLSKAPHRRLVLAPGPLQTQLCALVAGRPLTSILVLDVRQRGIDVWSSKEKHAAELLLERLGVYAPEDPPPPARPRAVYDELTIERRDGEARDMVRLLHVLRETFQLAASDDTRVARGLALLGRNVPPAPADPRVVFHDTVQLAARKTVSQHLGRLRVHDPGTRIGEDPEALHNLRVAVRRLRAAVRVFSPAFPSRWREHLISELRWLGQITGSVRDLDIQLARIQLCARALPPGRRAGLPALRAYMGTERLRRRARLLAGLNSRRYFHLLINLEGFALGRSHTHVSDPDAHEPIAQAGARHIRRAWRRLLRRGNNIKGAPAPGDLHVLRIRAKRLRYLLEFLQELTGNRGRRLVKRLVGLQDLLGAYHDAVVTAEFVRHYAEGPGAQLGAAGLLTLGALANGALRVADGCCGEFQHTWRRFSRKRTRREFRALARRLGSIAPSAISGAGHTTRLPVVADLQENGRRPRNATCRGG